MDYREIWKAHYVRIMHLQRFLQRIIKDFRQKKKFIQDYYCPFMHFHRKDPEYRQYPGERITRLLIILQNCPSFFVFWTV